MAGDGYHASLAPSDTSCTAYLFGFPALFRDFTWRIAEAARARVLCIDY